MYKMAINPRLPSLLLILALLSGCGSMQPRDSEPQTPRLSWQQQAERLSQQQDWSLVGKIGIRQQQERTSASLNWEQQQDHYQIFMTGPLGQGAVKVQGSDEGITMDVSGEGRYTADTPEALLADQLGWSLPLSNLRYWIKGLPAPGSYYQQQLDDANRLASLTQDQWHIRYPSYHRLQHLDLPRKLILNHGTDLSVTLIIKEWQLGHEDN